MSNHLAASQLLKLLFADTDCQFGVPRSPLAIAARPVKCGEPGTVIVAVPRPDGFILDRACLSHAVKLAVDKLIAGLVSQQREKENENDINA